MEGREGTVRRASLDVIGRLINQSLAGVNYLLTIAVSVVVIIVAIVAFRSLVEEGEPPPVTTTTTAPPRQVTAPAAIPLPEPVTTRPARTNCIRQAPLPDDRTFVFRLYYDCGIGDDVFGAWVYRQVDTEGGPLSRTMQALVEGPTSEERADGFRSLFSSTTAGSVLSVSRSDGDVVVDLRDLGSLPSLKVGSEGAEFLASLNNSLFQHDIVDTIEYRIDGDCDRFWDYFGASDCTIIARDAWQDDPRAASP